MMSDSWRTSVFFLILASCIHGCAQGFTVNDETNLRNNALTNYSSDVRPSAVTEVTLMLHVTTITVVDITNEKFGVSGWWSMRWTDDRLKWTAYPNIPWVQYKPEKVWTPVLVVSNSLTDLSAIDEDTIPIRVNRGGVATWNPPGLEEVGCSMDVTYFPFDTQTCNLEVTSFGYTIQELDLDLLDTGLSFRYFAENGEWSLVSTWSERSTFTEDGFQYARVTFYFKVKRKPLYYGLNMLLPVMVCAAVTMFVFLLPPESGEKIGYCLTILLAFMVILTLVATDLPTTATNTSILEMYIAVVLIMGGLSVIFAIIGLHIFFQPEEKPIPHTVRKLTLFGMWLCCYESCFSSRVEPRNESIRRGPKTAGTEPDSLQESALTDFRMRQFSDPSARKFALNKLNQKGSSISWYQKDSMGQDESHIREHDQIPRPHLIKQQTMENFKRQNSMKSLNHDVSNNDESVDLTWQTVARVMDSVLLRVYLVLMVISSLVILLVLIV